MKKVYDAVATTGKYQKNGQEKNRYMTVGAVFVNERGQHSMKLEALPLGEFNGWINFYEPKERSEQKPAAEQPAPSTDDEFQDSVPF
jgi:hypothetical protein